MLTVRIIPCLDVRADRVVKGIRFQDLRDSGSPPELAELYQRQGADEITMLDVAATPEGRATRYETVRAVRRRLALPLTVGGGVSSIDIAQALLEAGADKVSVNTAAVERPQVLTEMAKKFGDNKDVADVFNQLADDEKVHEEQFKALVDKVPQDDDKPERYELYQFLKATAISEFFQKDYFKDVDNISNPTDALVRALSLEKATLQYYQAIAELLED